ncbi:MAG: exonuclease domain-containing protein [Bacteriovoracales bacterium]|nr:exonuclease domain-containing protein [Bacteriovoracales bacterium]
MELGKWCVLDIETTGIDPHRDQVIDVGFLQFSGTKLTKTYDSLVYYEGEVSQFIQKLTGITGEMLSKAPRWRETENILKELTGHKILAHNAKFEESFLGRYFELPGGKSSVEFQDSLLFLGLLFPDRSSLGLESFIVDFQIHDRETHRGLQDAFDLIKVLLTAGGLCLREEKYRVRKNLCLGACRTYELDELWPLKFLNLTEKELSTLAGEIEFDLWDKVQGILDSFEEMEGESGPSLEFDSTFSGDNVKAIWRNEEVKKTLPFYSYRKEQEELSLKVGQSFKNNVHAMIQAPTGTGKTLGYLLPAGLFSLSEQHPVLVATATKTLQHQVINKDMPLLRKIMAFGEEDFKVCSLVGSQNHFCRLLQLRDLEEDFLLETKAFLERYALAVMDIIFGLNERLGMRLRRGDTAHVLKRICPPLEAFEKKIAVDFRSCIGHKCPHKGDCTYIRGLREAKDANIVVGNHALLFQWPKGLPRPSYMVVDEAHKLEKEVTDAFSLKLEEKDFTGFISSLEQLQGIGALFYLLSYQSEDPQEATEAIKRIQKEVLSSVRALRDHLDPFRDVCELYFKKRPRYTSLYWNEAPILKGNQLGDEISQAIDNHLKSILFILKELYDLITPYAGLYSSEDFNEENALSAFSKFESFYSTLEEYYQCISQVMEEGPKYANSFSYHEEYGFALQSIPIDVGKIVHDRLLEVSESVVFTSATLGNMDGSFATQGLEWSLGHTYLDPKKRYRSGFFLKPIYDYKNHAKVFLCDDVPAMGHPDFIPEVLEPVIKLIKNLMGRGLLLFSSRVRFEAAREFLLGLIGDELPLFVQGMGNNVVEDYRKSPHGILLGMESFGEGIDLPGESLQFVFIDKIPDIRQDIVIQKRRDFFQRSFGNEFTDYFLAHRSRSLLQKLGRLLRREQDIGGAIIVDARIKNWKRRTVEQFNRLVEPYEIQRGGIDAACREVYHFLSSENKEISK